MSRHCTKKEDSIPGLSCDVCVAELVPDEVFAPFEVRIQHFVQPLNLVAVPIRACACVRVGTNGMESA